MSKAEPRILIQGVGAVGGVIAAELLKRSYAVDLVTGNSAIAAAINRRGLEYEADGSCAVIRAAAQVRVDELPTDARYDVVLLATMADQVVDATRAALPRLAESGYFVALQNGFVEDAVAAVCGHQRVVSASVVFGASMPSPAHYHLTFRGRLFIGELDGGNSARVQQLKALLDGVGDVVISDNIVGVLWSKLAWNCAVSALCAVSGKLLGELLDDADGRELALISYREALDTAAASQIKLERVAVDHNRFYLSAGADANTRARVLSDFASLAARYQGVKPSTLGSLERGRKSEIRWLNGYLVECARAVGVAVPLNAALTAMVEQIECGARAIDPRNLAELANV